MELFLFVSFDFILFENYLLCAYLCVCVFWPSKFFHLNDIQHVTINVIFLQQQEPIESTMDETANNRSNIVCNAKETTAEEGRLISKAIFNTPNTGNPGKNYLVYTYIWYDVLWSRISQSVDINIMTTFIDTWNGYFRYWNQVFHGRGFVTS